jgi:hypothetical protein
MKLTVFLFAVVSCLTNLTAHAVVYTLGGPVVNPANGHSYYLLSESTWTDAEAFAQTLGGHLATINDASEDSWVYNTFATMGSPSRTLWIGLNDVASEGTFVWASGEAVTYLNWHAFEPNNFGGNEDYAFIFPPADVGGRASLWNDNDNFGTIGGSSTTVPVNGVVEVVPEPSTMVLAGLGAAFGIRRLRAQRHVR